MAILRNHSATTAQLSLQGQWRFDETGGAIAVESVHGLDGEYHGSVIFSQTCPVGSDGAVRLGGDGSFVLIRSATGGSFAIDPDGAGDGFTPPAGPAGVSLNHSVAYGNPELT
jgi:hypothetical protein